MATLVGGPEAGEILALPEDGLRHELIDGVHHVTPAPGEPHQGVVAELLVRLWSAVPAEMTVRTAPYDWVITEPDGREHRLQPDLLVLTRAETRVPLLRGALPLLVVEVLSPGAANHARDLQDKFTVYERAGLPAYWVVDPSVPSLAAWELGDARLVLRAQVRGGEWFVADRPCPLRLRPGDLVDAPS